MKAKSRLAAVILLGLWACSDPLLCTLIGCSNGLLLTFDRPPDPGTIVSIENLGVPWRVECGADVDCSRGIFLPDFRPEHISVRIITSNGEVWREIRPEYLESHPNGENCPDTCFRAEVMLELP